VSDDGMALGERLTELAKNRLGETWNELEEFYKMEMKEALADLGNLLILQMVDPENPIVESEMRFAKARVANWTFVGADKVQEAVKSAMKEAFELLGSLVKGFLT
jgi:hypothetical protein